MSKTAAFKMPVLRAMADAEIENKRAFLVEVHQRLCAEYNCPIEYFHNLDPLSELVSSLLSHRTAPRTQFWKPNCRLNGMSNRFMIIMKC
jgi:hypothetical protein